MDQYSAAELTELWLMSQSEINAQFEFWLTVSFAVIVASFIGRKRLNRNLRFVVALLYSLAVIVFVSRWYYAVGEAQMFRAALLESGVALSTPWITAIARVTLVALGTLTALIFLLSKKFHFEPDG
jgi:hypothetical protein